EICNRLHIEQSTLSSHVKSIYRKLGVHRRRAAIEAMSRDLLPRGDSN
ncbi:MAG: hypothetical protein KGR26_08940, partial [Cyanobacteria bacterium REEB65]|nr:hypothetical protein [Cyanobacteria bacterium REEB65]